MPASGREDSTALIRKLQTRAQQANRSTFPQQSHPNEASRAVPNEQATQPRDYAQFYNPLVKDESRERSAFTALSCGHLPQGQGLSSPNIVVERV